MKLPRKQDGDLIEGKDPKKHRHINVSGKQTVKLGKGDRFVIQTPGGGAWGQPEDKENTPLLLARVHLTSGTVDLREVV